MLRAPRKRTTRNHTKQYRYPYRWHKLARRHKEENPVCAECLKLGIWTPMLNEDGSARGATDHIIPHRGSDRLRWAEDNLQSLCKRHHDEKTKRGL